MVVFMQMRFAEVPVRNRQRLLIVGIFAAVVIWFFVLPSFPTRRLPPPALITGNNAVPCSDTTLPNAVQWFECATDARARFLQMDVLSRRGTAADASCDSAGLCEC